MNLTIQEQELVYQFYGVELYEVISSPLPDRDDVKPSFSTIIIKDRVKWSDFGAGLLGMSVFDFVMEMEGCNFYNSKKKIERILRGIDKVELNKKSKETVRKQEHDIEVMHSHNWEDFEIEYWADRKVSKEQLEKSLTFPMRVLKIDKSFAATSTSDDPKFIYYMGDSISETFKIYSPFSKDNKWISNRLDLVDYETSLQGEYEDLMLLSGRKDNLVFDNYGLPFDTTSPLSESNFGGILRQLDKEFRNYRNIFSLFDFDDRGEEFSSKLGQLSNGRIKPIILGDINNYLHSVGIKDIDNIETHGDYELKKLVIDEIKSKAR